MGEALPNTEVFRRLAAAMGLTDPCFRDSDDDLIRQALSQRAPAHGAASPWSGWSARRSST